MGSEYLHPPTAGQNRLTQSLRYNEGLNTSHNLLTTVLKGKNRMAVWVQNGSERTGCLPLWSHGWRRAAAHYHCQHLERVSDPVSLAQESFKIQSTKSTECVLLSHHHKLGPSILWHWLGKGRISCPLCGRMERDPEFPVVAENKALE